MSIKIEINVLQKFFSLLSYLHKLLKKINITHLLLFVFALHLFVMPFPSDGGMIFDEVHYIKATRAHFDGIGANAEHTPLVKVFMMLPFTIFGDYWFSWRFPIVISCMIAYTAFYYIAKHFLDEKYALLATAFLCFDIMFFIHGTIFLLDMPAIMFGLIAIALFLYGYYKTSALSMALSILCKEITVLFLGIIGIYWLGKNIHKMKLETLKVPLVYLSIVTLVGFSFIAVYDNVYKISSETIVNKNVHNTVVNDGLGNPITTYINTSTNTYSKYVNNPIEHLQLYLTYHTDWMTNLNSSYRAFQKPWNWIAPFDINGVFDHPVYFQVAVTGSETYYPISYRAQGSIPIWYSIWLVVPASVYMLAKKKETKLSLLLLGWITSTYFTWIALELIKKSTGFNYYFIYTVPAMCLGIPYVISNLKISETKKKLVTLIYISTTVLFFVYYFPIGVFR